MSLAKKMVFRGVYCDARLFAYALLRKSVAETRESESRIFFVETKHGAFPRACAFESM